jgi:hypothetical protein
VSTYITPVGYTCLDRWKVDSPLNTFLALTSSSFSTLEFRSNCVTTYCFCMGCYTYMLQRVGFFKFNISNESAEFCALSLWYVYVLATVLSFLFLWVWKKALSNLIHLIFRDLLLTRAFLLKMQAATPNNFYHLYMVIFGGGSLKKSVQNLRCTVTTNFNP